MKLSMGYLFDEIIKRMIIFDENGIFNVMKCRKKSFDSYITSLSGNKNFSKKNFSKTVFSMCETWRHVHSLKKKK